MKTYKSITNKVTEDYALKEFNKELFKLGIFLPNIRMKQFDSVTEYYNMFTIYYGDKIIDNLGIHVTNKFNRIGKYNTGSSLFFEIIQMIMKKSENF